SDSPLLSCDSVNVSYGQVQVLFDVDFEVNEGEVLALLGTNGAGKSTLLRAVAGLTPPSSGRITFDGADVTRVGPEQMAARGVVQMPGGRAIYPTLTVGENLKMATWLYRGDKARIEEGTERVLGLFPALRPRLHDRAALLSGGQQQMLALAQSLLGNCRLLMIDELALGLAPIVVAGLLDVLHGLKDEGLTIVLVEQSVNVALSIADRATFMEKGEVKFTGDTADLLGRDDLLRSVFFEGNGRAGVADRGGVAKAGRPPTTRSAAEQSSVVPPAVLRTNSLGVTFGVITAVDDVTMSVAQGEILGILGPNGAGKTTLFDLLSGFTRPSAGRVWLLDTEITEDPPDIRALAGLGRSFQDARLFPSLTTAENLAVACESLALNRDPIAAVLRAPASLLSEDDIADRVEVLIELFGLARYRDMFAGSLSTGTRRVMEIASLVAQEPVVLLLDEPGAGIAQRDAEALGPLLWRLRERLGCSIVMIEHDVPLLVASCDRLLAMERGRVIADGAPEVVINESAVVRSYLGTDITAIQRSGNVPPRRRRQRPRAAAIKPPV
ncbi:MAG: ATP-binding cassette domain-containing protein, partial [Acidimicrobiales bacterium]|nr:ATP-binding cassette domain-containing protein [Acidimicrobiales bacterium]